MKFNFTNLTIIFLISKSEFIEENKYFQIYIEGYKQLRFPPEADQPLAERIRFRLTNKKPGIKPG